GSTIFGPRPRSYAYRLPARARRTALRAAIADRTRGGALTVIDRIELPEPKTKQVVAMLSALQLAGSVLVVTGGAHQALARAARNLKDVKVLRAEGVNVYDVLRHKQLLLTRDAVAALAERVAP